MSRPASEGEAFHVFPADSETAVVAFGWKGWNKGPFPYHSLIDQLPPSSRVIVNDPAGAWYNAGLAGVGDTVEEIAAWIESRLAELGANRVLTFGASMGGYGAILFGCLIGAARAVAFSPQTILDPRLPLSPPADVRLQAADLEPIVRANPATRIDIAVGWDVLLDVFHAERLAELPSVRILALDSGNHVAVAELHRAGQLAPLLREALAGGDPEQARIAPELGPDARERIVGAIYAEQRKDWSELARQIEPLVERYPEWMGPRFQLARAFVAMDDTDRAAALLEQVVGSSPRWLGPRRVLADLRLRSGDPEAAEQVVREGLDLSPEWSRGHLTLGWALLRQERVGEAVEAAQHARELQASLSAEVERLLDEAAAHEVEPAS